MGNRVVSLFAGLSAWSGFLFVFTRLLMDKGHSVHVSAGVHGVHGPSSETQFWIWMLVGVAAVAALFFGAFALLRKARMLEDIPTSLVRSAAQGYVELTGHAQLLPGPPIISPLSRQYCAWWSYSIRHYDSASREWETVESQTSGELFTLVDETGACIVDPEGAQVTPSLVRSWRGGSLRPRIVPKKSEWIGFGDYKYTEQMIFMGDPLYAIGQFRTQGAILEMDEARDVSALLADWKRDRRELLDRFDTNKDGQIDMAEWEAARRAALEQVRSEQVEQSTNPDLHVLSRPGDGKPFLLSTKTQEQLTLRYRGWAAFCLLTSVALALALFVTVSQHA